MENRGGYNPRNYQRGNRGRGGGRAPRGGGRGYNEGWYRGVRADRGGERGYNEGGYRGVRADRGGGPPNHRGQYRGEYFDRADRGRGGYHYRANQNDAVRNHERNHEPNRVREQRGRQNGPATSQSESAPNPIPYNRLKEMWEDENLEGTHIALQLSSDQSGFARRLRENMDDGMIQMLLKVIGKMCKGDNLPSSFSNVLTMILRSNFCFQLIPFLHDLIRNSRTHKAQTPLHVDNCLALLRAWVERIPTTSENEVSMLLTNIKHIVVKLDIGLEKDIAQNIEEISEILEELEKKNKPASDALLSDSRQELYGMHDERPPNDFRSLSVFPQVVDLNQTSQPYVRTNLVDSAYRDINHYLDVQFRLLREDFVRPLREGIENCFTAGGGTNLRRKDQQNIKVYENVTIEYPLPGRSGIQYCIHFNATKLQRVRWQTSRRLMYGNLVCLSADKFKENFLFATITDRDPCYLQNGYVCVEFVCNDGVVGAAVRQNLRDLIEEERREVLENLEDNDMLEEVVEQLEENIPEEVRLAEVSGNNTVRIEDMNKRYYMVETEAYFVAYRHVLSGLKDDGNPIRAPTVDITNDQDWPSAHDLCLDSSQAKALKSAVTNELSVIQGPPGTGKTHVGLVIMKLLLANKDLRKVPRVADVDRIRTGAQHAQILVVCYTNHALDQFLEGVVKFCKYGVVRVGGRCRSKELEQYKLVNVRKSRPHTSTSNFHRRTVYQLRSDLRRLQDSILSVTDLLDVSTRTIVKLSQLKQVIPVHLYDQLTETRLKGDEALLQWLGVSEPVHILQGKQYIVVETIKAISQPLVEAGFDFAQLVAAMIGTGQFDGDVLVNWMIANPHAIEKTGKLPAPDLVYSYLDKFEITFDAEELFKEGFHPIEVKCALLATGYIQPNVNYIRGWLLQRTAEKEPSENANDDAKVVENENDDANSIQDDDIAFIEEQRQMETDDEDDDSIDENESNQKRRNAEAMKNIEKQLAATYEQVSDGGWQLQPHEKKRRKRKINEQIGRVDAMTKRQAEEVWDLFQLDQNERWKLYRRWIQDLRHRLRPQIDQTSKEYNRIAKVLTEAKNEEDFQILRTADVIGMTTTGAAQFRDIVNKLPAKVVIVEEAAEVLEAHIVTSLPQRTEHLILIGDHQQLKPSPTVYELAKKFNLDVSLFERMIKNGIPCSKLELQHRMRPRIADLIRPHIYTNLRDHTSVQVYDDVKGIQKNIFFVAHEHEEEAVADGKSKINYHEATFLVALCQYIHQQGYSLDQITILTTYVGQLHVINRILPPNLRRVRVSAVDNFQGEENDIILLSLVRSNEEGKIGFLSVENRVCVALSRAKKGLYCVGNATILREKSSLWRSILMKLERDNLFGEKLPLHCSNHPDRAALVGTAKDFEKVSEGGCGQKCTARLSCGHVCTRSCHPDDQEHKLFKCRKPCERSCENNHPCKLQCFKKCSCEVKMMKTIPKCGHQQKMKCNVDPSTFICRVPCSDVKACGHKCSGICGSRCPDLCSALVLVNPACGHAPVKVPCHSASTPPRFCSKPCDITLLCGHKCSGSCEKCCQGRIHLRCQQKCSRILFCGHICQERCSAKCPPCNQPCQTACAHSKCLKKCFEPCVLCKEKCTARFPGNQKCSKLCSEPCDKKANNTPCIKRLKCGHQCIGLAYERCPKLCRVCDKDKVTEIFFGNEGEKNARFVELECGHIFNYVDLDKWMEQESTENDELNIQWKECPKCKTVIRKSNRYRHIINKQLMLINEVKEKINGKLDNIEAMKRDLKAAIKRSNSAKYFLRRSTADSRSSWIEKRREEQAYEYLEITVETASTTNELALIETQFRNLKRLKKIKKLLNDTATKRTEIYEWKIDLLKDLTRLQEWLFNKRAYFSDQELADFEGECKRLKHSVSCVFIHSTITAIRTFGNFEFSDLDEKLKIARNILLEKPQRYETIANEIEPLMEEIEKSAPSLAPGLGITVDERNMIVKAMSFGKGHWNKCKNGHVYCIGDCGGPNERGTCPECKEAIGGVNHRLAEGNQLAPEMDGATRPAYDPLNFNIPEELLH